MKNLTDERAYSGGGAIIDAAGSVLAGGVYVPARIDVTLLQPRTVGLSMDFEF